MSLNLEIRLSRKVEQAIIDTPGKIDALNATLTKIADALLSAENDELTALKDQLAQSEAALQAAVAANTPPAGNP